MASFDYVLPRFAFQYQGGEETRLSLLNGLRDAGHMAVSVGYGVSDRYIVVTAEMGHYKAIAELVRRLTEPAPAKTSFVLKATTRGDELIPSSTGIVATSDDRSALEKLKDDRAKERQEWLDKHGSTIPWWAECSIVDNETIEEVASV